LDSNYGESMSSREESVDMLEGDPSTDADSVNIIYLKLHLLV